MLTLVKFEDLKSMLSLEGASMDDYPSLKLIAESVYAAIETYVGRYLERDVYTETVPIDGKLIPLRALPIASITSIVVDDLVVDVAQCTRRKYDVELPFHASGEATVVYDGGLEEATGDLKRAALLQTLHEWARRDTIGATNVSTEGGMTSWPELGLLKEVRRVLDPLVHTARLI